MSSVDTEDHQNISEGNLDPERQQIDLDQHEIRRSVDSVRLKEQYRYIWLSQFVLQDIPAEPTNIQKLSPINYADLFQKINPSIIQFLPQMMEDQIYQRYEPKTDVTSYTHMWSITMNQINDKLEEYFTEKHYKGDIRYISTNNQSAPHVLLFLDFYQHPIHYIPFINYLCTNNYQVTVPYLIDSLRFDQKLCQNKTGQTFAEQVFKKLEEFVSKQLDGQDFFIIALGHGGTFGIRIYDSFPQKCKKLILLNNAQQYQVDDLQPVTSLDQLPLHQSLISQQFEQSEQQSDPGSYSVKSEDEADAQQLVDGKVQELSNLSEVSDNQMVPQISVKASRLPQYKRTFSICIKPSHQYGMQQDVYFQPQGNNFSQQQKMMMQFSKQMLERTSFASNIQTGSLTQPTVQDIQISDAFAEKLLQMDNLLDLVYSDQYVQQFLQQQLQFKELPRIIEKMRQFVSTQVSFLSKHLQMYVGNYVQTLTFAPLIQLKCFDIYPNCIDKKFFEYMKYYENIHCDRLVHVRKGRIIQYYSTHSIFLTPELLIQNCHRNNSQLLSQNTILAAGHDLLLSIPEIIVCALKQQ